MRRHLEKREVVPYVTRAKIWAAFDRQNPEIGLQFDQFIETQSAEYGYSTDAVREVIASYIEVHQLKVNEDRHTAAQKTAILLGTTKAQVINVLKEALSATKSELIYEQADGAKFAKVGPDGELLVHEQPDWKARLDAAKQLNQIQGAFAPDQLVVDLNARVQHTHQLSDAELDRRWQSIPIEVKRILAPRAIEGAGDSGGDQGAAGVGRNHAGDVVLDISMHEVQGRAGA